MLEHTGDYVLVPFLEDHDYVMIPSSTAGVGYHHSEPQCLQDFNFFTVLKQPEVYKSSIKC